MTLATFTDHMGIDPVAFARDIGLTQERTMELLRDVGEPMTDVERDQIERTCLEVYGVSPLTLEAA